MLKKIISLISCLVIIGATAAVAGAASINNTGNSNPYNKSFQLKLDTYTDSANYTSWAQMNYGYSKVTSLFTTHYGSIATNANVRQGSTYQHYKVVYYREQDNGDSKTITKYMTPNDLSWTPEEYKKADETGYLRCDYYPTVGTTVTGSKRRISTDIY